MNEPMSRLQPATEGKARFSTAEFLCMIESGALDDIKVELVEGELERMPLPENRHGMLQAHILARLGSVVTQKMLLGGTGIDLGRDTLLAADVFLVRSVLDENRMLVPDDILLIVEIAQTMQARDMGMKRIAYAAAGIAHYWVIDGERSVIHVYGEPLSGDYAEVRTVKFGEPLAVPGTSASITID